MDYKFQDLIDVSKLQELLDSLNEAVPLATRITDNKGNVVAATGRQDICTKFHQINPVIEQQCRESDLYLFNHLNGNKPVVIFYKCLNGLVESGTPLIIGDMHIGNVYISQFFFEKPDLEVFRKRAKQYGFEEKSYLEAVEKVPVMDRVRLERHLAFIRKVMEILGENRLKNLMKMESSTTLGEDEIRLRTIFNSINDAIFIHDIATGAILDVNQRMCELYDCTREEALNLDVGMLSSGEPPYTQQEAMRWMQKAAAGDPQLFKWRARTKKGHLFWCEVNMQRVRIWKNDRLLVTVRDITERILVEEEISRLAAIVESSNDAIIGKTMEGIIVSWNAGAERLYGYSKAEAIGRPISFLFLPGRHDDLPQIFDRIRRGEGINLFETERLTKDGRIIEVSLTISPIMDALGQIVGASTIARDITEQKQAKERLKESETRLSAVLRSIQTGIAIIDSETHRIVEANAAALRWIAHREKRSWAQYVINSYALPK